MGRQLLRSLVSLLALAAVAVVGVANPVFAAPPAISRLSLRGLQLDATTTLVVEGSDLLPNPHLLLNVPIKNQSLKEGGKPNRIELEVTLEKKEVSSGIYLARLVTDDGVSNALPIGIDPLPQVPFAAEITTLPVALHGAISNNQVLRTSFTGHKNDEVVIEIEAKRFGSAINPVLHLLDSRRAQIAWGQEQSNIGGDARIVAKLPSDGKYTIELHDALYQAGNANLFRLKIGPFKFADFMLPLAIPQDSDVIVQLVGTNWNLADAPVSSQKAKKLFGVQRLTGYSDLVGFRPGFLVSEIAEIVQEPDPKTTNVPTAPVGISSRLTKGVENKHQVTVQPGKKLRIEVFAQRLGSPLDGVLFVRDEKGSQLATSDDQPGTSDPGLDFTVPPGVKTLNLAVKDVAGRSGENFVYRLVVSEAAMNDFSLSVANDHLQIYTDSPAIIRVDANRKGYNGPIKLSMPDLSTNISTRFNEIPANASAALVEMFNDSVSIFPEIGVFTIQGETVESKPRFRPALTPENATLLQQPWLRTEIAFATATKPPFFVAWDTPASDDAWLLGTTKTSNIKVTRSSGVSGAVRLSLITSQVIPKKPAKPKTPPKKGAKPVKNAPPAEKPDDDLDRALRLEELVTVPADKVQDHVNIVVPGDLPRIPYDIALRGELLSADGKSVVATAYTGVRRISVQSAFHVELVGETKIDARAGLGETGKLTGKIVRTAGYNSAISLTLEGLPDGVFAKSLEVPGDKTEFEFPVALNFGAKPGELKGAKLVGLSVATEDTPTSVRSNEIALMLKVVPGEKPPVIKPRELFEDDKAFVDLLNEGDGQAVLTTEDKYSGTSSIKVSAGQKLNPAIPNWSIKIREKPAEGEFRFIRFAWKKFSGTQICLQLNHDGQWGAVENNPGKFRYHAGQGECFGGSLMVDEKIPKDWTVVTRDLFADFGEFTLTGLALSPIDGAYGLYDHIYLGTSIDDLDSVKK